MLRKITEGVWVHQSECLESNATVVKGGNGVLLIDPGLTSDEMASIADDLEVMGLPVVAGFSTHPHWDHVLWHARFGDVPRYGTSTAAVHMHASLSNPNWKEEESEGLPEEIAGQVPLDDLFGKIVALPDTSVYFPWKGPKVRIIEHSAHAPGHAALFVEQSKVLVAGDMLSDVFVPMLDQAAGDPTADYLKALDHIQEVAANGAFVVPGHGSVGDASQVQARIDQDRAYVQALRDGNSSTVDPRIVSPKAGWEWVSSMHEWQVQTIASKK